MKILYFDYDDLHNPYANGGQAYTTSQLTVRLAKDHQITVVTGNYPRSREITLNGVSYIRLGIGNLGYFVSLISYWFLIPFYVVLNQKYFDKIVECFTGPFTASLLPLFTTKPVIGVAHFFNSEMMARKYKIPFNLVRDLLIRRYRNIIVFTEVLKKQIHLLNKNAKIFVIPGGITDDFLINKIKPGKYVLYLGRIDIFNKGLDLLVRAWKDIDEKLIIAGSGQPADETQLKQVISANHLGDRVSFIGRVDGKKKLELFSNSLFVVQPSKYETFGYVALETLASGKLLVCFDIPGFSWVPNVCSVKITNIDEKSLEKTIKKLLTNKKSLSQYEISNRKFAQRFSWDSIARQYLNALEDKQ